MISAAAAARVGKSLQSLLCRVIPKSQQNVPSPSQARLLLALLNGGTLKSHRYLDGRKEYLLHPLRGEAIQVPSQDVRRLEKLDLLLSNHKFPSTTLLLSQSGRHAAAKEEKAAGAAPSPGDSAWNSGS